MVVEEEVILKVGAGLIWKDYVCNIEGEETGHCPAPCPSTHPGAWDERLPNLLNVHNEY